MLVTSYEQEESLRRVLEASGLRRGEIAIVRVFFWVTPQPDGIEEGFHAGFCFSTAGIKEVWGERKLLRFLPRKIHVELPFSFELIKVDFIMDKTPSGMAIFEVDARGDCVLVRSITDTPHSEIRAFEEVGDMTFQDIEKEIDSNEERSVEVVEEEPTFV